MDVFIFNRKRLLSHLVVFFWFNDTFVKWVFVPVTLTLLSGLYKLAEFVKVCSAQKRQNAIVFKRVRVKNSLCFCLGGGQKQ